MARARKHLISVEDTPVYHCVMRCVRRSFLCGTDKLTGKNFDHRKQWAVTRLRQLASVFAIDICAYAIMSNHYHVILHIQKPIADSWSQREVAERWKRIFKGEELVDQWLADEPLSEAYLGKVSETIEKWRDRLMDISWFMRCMNETMARQANAEDQCKGRFWEGRFKSQALLDEAALLACMVYVDLNPIRAGVSALPEESDFTSIQARLFQSAQQKKTRSAFYKKLEQRVEKQKELLHKLEDSLPQGSVEQAPLMPFGGTRDQDRASIPFDEAEYFELVEATGRLLKSGKKGFIPSEVPPLLERMNIEGSWVATLQRFGSQFAYSIGSKDHLLSWVNRSKRAWCKGLNSTLSGQTSTSFAA